MLLVVVVKELAIALGQRDCNDVSDLSAYPNVVLGKTSFLHNITEINAYTLLVKADFNLNLKQFVLHKYLRKIFFNQNHKFYGLFRDVLPDRGWYLNILS